MRLILAETDNGNCRIYYREQRRLLCFQEDRPGKFTLYRCSQDGEPEYEAKPAALQISNLPKDDSATARAFREWFSRNLEWEVWKPTKD